MRLSKWITKASALMIVLVMTLSSIEAAPVAASQKSPAKTTVPFQATFHHFSAPDGSCVDGVCDLTSYGYGTVNIMGSPFVLLVAHVLWNFNTSPCSTIESFEFTLVGETGSITISGTGTVCPGNSPDGFPESTSLVGEITGGTGEFSGITGTITGQSLTVAVGPILRLSGDVSY